MSFHQLISMAAGGRMHCPIEGNVRETPTVSAVEGKHSAFHRTRGSVSFERFVGLFHFPISFHSFLFTVVSFCI